MTNQPDAIRVARFADGLSVNRHYMTGQTCREVQSDVRALLAALEVTRTREAELERALEEIRGFAAARTAEAAGFGLIVRAVDTALKQGR